MKKLYAIILSLGIIGMSSCDYLAKDISEDMNFTVNGDLFKNTVQIEVVDAATGQSIPSLKGIYIEGPNSDVIYSQSGKKNPEYINNIISLGVDPKFLFSDDNPVQFNVAINAVGYLPTMKRILVYPNNFNQQIKIEMVNPLVSDNSLEVHVNELMLNNGKVISNALIKKNGGGPDTVYYDDDYTTIGLPIGTEFYYWEDKKTGEISSTISSWDDEIVKFENNGNEVYSKFGLFIDTNEIKNNLIDKTYSGSIAKAVIYYPKIPLSPFIVLPGDNYGFFGSRNITLFNPLLGNLKSISGDLIKFCHFNNAALKQILKIEFYGINSEGKEFQIYPKNNAVFYSLRLNPNVINPKNNQEIKEGDDIEVLDKYFFDNSLGALKGKYKLLNIKVLKDRNGFLRAQSSSPDVGFYFKPKYEKNVSIALSIISPEMIPDAENIELETYFVVENNKFPFNFYNDLFETHYILSKSIVSNSPINDVYLEISLKYFNKTIVKNFKVYEEFIAEDYIKSVINNDVVSFDINFICTKGTKVKPSIFTRVFVPSENTYYYANIKNGQWSTRGIEIGKEIKLNFTYDNIKVDTTIILQKNNVIKKDVAGSQFCR